MKVRTLLQIGLTLVVLNLTAVARPAAAAPVNQDWILMKGLLIRLLMLPVDPFTAFARNEVGKRYEEFEKRSVEATHTGDCELWSDQSLKPEAGRCSCEQVCPESFDILAKFRPRMEPKNENLLHFLNDEEDFDEIHPRTLGYCWAQTTVLRDFGYLAVFDAENRFGAEIPNREKQPKAWLKYYRGLIRQILSHEATVIPGFKNLWDFSSDEAINRELRSQTVKTWRKTAVRLESLPLLMRSINQNEMRPEEIRAFLVQVRHALSLNQTPKIWFTHEEDWKSIHVVPVYEVRETSEGTRVCFVDNHGYEEVHTDCGRSVLIRPDGSLYYKDWDFFKDRYRTIRVMGFTPEDRYENVRYVEQLSGVCRKQTQCANIK